MVGRTTKLAIAVIFITCLAASNRQQVDACLMSREQARMVMSNLLSRYPDLLTNPVIMPNGLNNNGYNNQLPNQGYNNQLPNQGYNNQLPNNQGYNNQLPNQGYNQNLPNTG